jgi:tetratricopeptide (TPR) repeat protein
MKSVQLDEIRDLLHGSNRNTILPVIGAGLSSPHLPGWSRLLEELIGESSREYRGSLTSALQAGNFLDVAALLEVDARVRAAGIAAAIKRHYAQPRMARPEVYDLVAGLPVTHFATTNFDPWLKDAVSHRLGTAPRTYTPWDSGGWNDLGQSSPPLVLMLHGDADRPATCVLSATAFRRLTHGNPAFRAGFSALIAGRSLLFLGHSLRDPDLMLMLDAWSEAMAGWGPGAEAPRHFLLTTEVDPVERTRLLNLGVQPVEFGPPGDYSALPGILRFLQQAPPATGRPSAVDSMARPEPNRDAASSRPVPAHDPERWNQVNQYVDAHRLVLSGNLAGAREKVAQAAAEGSDTALLLNLQALVLDRTDTNADLKSISSRILEHYGDEIGLAEEAMHLWFTTDRPVALAKSADALMEDPANILAWIVRGGVLMVDDPAKALRNVDAALNVFLPFYQAWAFRLRGQILLRLGQAEQALQAASASIELYPYSAYAHDARSSILLKLNRTAEALADLEEAIRLAPLWATPLRMKAAVLADLGRNEEAIAAASRALAVGGEDDLMLELQAECRKRRKSK